ncbi:MAG: hypothetical protein H6R18_1158 [Proteobacteria bacterium]|nr:hypothetical protein [Pseudomonadota bacterium]
MRRYYLILLLLLFPLVGCEQVNGLLGIEDLAKKEERLEADGRAVGGGCRQSGRAIEDCYAIYSWLPRAAVYAGWRDMDAYMRENKIETIEPQLPPVEPPGSRKRRAVDDEEDDKPTKKPASKAKVKTAAPTEIPVEKTESTDKAAEKPTTATTTTTTNKPAATPEQKAPTAKVKSTP